MTTPPRAFEPRLPRQLLLAGYAIGLVLVFLPVLETFGALWPPRPDVSGWRFGATGIFFTFLMMAPLGLLLALAVGSILKHRIALRALAFFALVFALLIAILFGSFSLDFIQVRPMIQARVRGGFDMAAVKATLSAIFSLVSCMILAVAGFREARDLSVRQARRTRPDRAEDVVIGRKAVRLENERG